MVHHRLYVSLVKRKRVLPSSIETENGNFSELLAIANYHFNN